MWTMIWYNFVIFCLNSDVKHFERVPDLLNWVYTYKNISEGGRKGERKRITEGKIVSSYNHPYILNLHTITTPGVQMYLTYKIQLGLHLGNNWNKPSNVIINFPNIASIHTHNDYICLVGHFVMEFLPNMYLIGEHFSAQVLIYNRFITEYNHVGFLY